MGNHRNDSYFGDQKQHGNPQPNRPKPVDSQDWTPPNGTEPAPVIGQGGFMIKQTNTLRAELERSRQRGVAAMERLKNAASKKVEFLEKLADMAENDLEETQQFHDSLGV